MLIEVTVTSLPALATLGLVILLGCAVAISTALSLYLLLLAVASFRRTRQSVIPGAPVTRFAILIPAHEEELVIGSLLESVNALDYPRDLYTVQVVADHCSDHTAVIARGLGATVYERNDPEPRGKSWSLNRLVRQLLKGEGGGFVDAFVVVDADSKMSPNFLRVMDARLRSGIKVIQSLVQIDDPGASSTGQLRGLAYEFISHVRPLGRSAMGLSAGLRGNGMCIARDVAARFSWNTDSLTEDYELHGRLLAAGIRTAFAPEATVWTQLPASSGSAQTQSQRWERGRLDTMRSSAPSLLAYGLRTGSWSSIDGALELLIPPFSILVAVTIILFGLSVLSGSIPLIVVALIGLAAQCVYTLRGLVPAAKRYPHVYGALFLAPVFVVRRLWLYLTVLTRRTRVQWTRTVRTPPS
jgi:1,2-diacylglycerol 3-beta-glucosyltransferase